MSTTAKVLIAVGAGAVVLFVVMQTRGGGGGAAAAGGLPPRSQIGSGANAWGFLNAVPGLASLFHFGSSTTNSTSGSSVATATDLPQFDRNEWANIDAYDAQPGAVGIAGIDY